MATVSFGGTAEQPTDKQLAEQKPQPPANYLADEDVSGEFDSSDLVFPRINFVQKTGDLADLFKPGLIVLNKQVEIGAPDKPLEVTALRFKKQYQEQIEYGSGEFGKVFDTKREVVEAGGQTSAYGESGYYGPLGTILFLIRMPEHLEAHLNALFPYVCDGVRYALAVFTASGSAYTGCGMPLASQKQATGTVRGVTWKLTPVFTKKNSNSWYKPTLTPCGTPSPALTEFISKLPL